MPLVFVSIQRNIAKLEHVNIQLRWIWLFDLWFKLLKLAILTDYPKCIIFGQFFLHTTLEPLKIEWKFEHDVDYDYVQAEVQLRYLDTSLRVLSDCVCQKIHHPCEWRLRWKKWTCHCMKWDFVCDKIFIIISYRQTLHLPLTDVFCYLLMHTAAMRDPSLTS